MAKSVRNNLDDTQLAILLKLTDASERGVISRENANRALGRTDTDAARTRKYLNWRLKPLLNGGYIEAIHLPSQSDGSRPLVGYRVLPKVNEALGQSNASRWPQRINLLVV